MNKIYRVVWNCTLRVYQVCSEHTRRLGKTASVQQAVTVSPGYAALSVKSFRPLPLLVMLALSGTVQAEVLTIDNGDSRTYSNALTVEGVVVGNQTNGTLIITDGGSITSSSRASVIGAYATGVGTATVQGSGIWNLVLARLSIGDSGTGTLNVLSGGTVTAGDTDLGYRTGGNGTLLVDGAGSTLSTAGMYVGRSGNGAMTIRNEGRVTTTEDTIIASGTGVVGAVEVSNNGRWDLINKTGQLPNLNIGYHGTGTLDINSNGSVTTGVMTLGSFEDGKGCATVSGSGSVLTTTSLRVSDYGEGELTISDFGVVYSNGNSTIARSATGTGTVTVSTGGEWEVLNGQQLLVGQSGSGTLNINSAGKVIAGDTFIGSRADSQGIVTVDGEESKMTTAELVVADSGTGNLSISNLAVVQSTGASAIGLNGDSVGVVSVTENGQWNLTNNSGSAQTLVVGTGGNGTLNIASGGKVDAGDVSLARWEMATGGVDVKGEGSQLNTAEIIIAERGAGTLNISDAAEVNTSSTATIGDVGDSVGVVNVGTKGQWNVVSAGNSPQTLMIGDWGNGTLNIASEGTVTAGGTTVGVNNTGVGLLNVNGAGAVMNSAALRVGHAGQGTLNITDAGVVNTASTGQVATYFDGTGTVNVNTNGQWNVASNLQVGVTGNGTLNIASGGQVNGEDAISVGTNDRALGRVNVDGEGSLLRGTTIDIGAHGDGAVTLSNEGTLALTNGSVLLGFAEGSTGSLNIGAAHDDIAAVAGHLIGADSVAFGAGNGSLVFNHTDDSATGYAFNPLISGESGAVIQDAGHTVLTAENTYGGRTEVNGGTLTVASHSSTGNTGLGSSAVNIADAGTLSVTGASEASGGYALSNALTGNGLLQVNLASADNAFSFTDTTGSAFTGTAELKNSIFDLSGDNTLTLAQATLKLDAGNTTTVGDGAQQIGGLHLNGGKLIFNTEIPANTLAQGAIQTGTLTADTGTVQVTVASPWNDPGAMNPDTTLNLLEQDDTDISVQLVQAQEVTGSGGALTLTDQNGDAVAENERVAIAQNGTVVADGDYGFRLTTAPGDGLYVNYGLKALDIHAGQTLVLAEHAGAQGAAADMSAAISGEGNLGINTAGLVSLSNASNRYSGETQVQAGTLRTDADGALGNTSALVISDGAIADLNGTTQTAGRLSGETGSTLALNGGSLTLQNGGTSQGSLTGAGNLGVAGGVLTIDGANVGLSATTTIESAAEVVLNDAQGAGSGNVTDDGTLTLNGVTGELLNSLSGAGIVDVAQASAVAVSGDNQGFSGQFRIDGNSAMTITDAANLGTASVTDNGLLTVATDSDWTLSHTVSGSGNLNKQGSGTLTLTADSAGYTGTTDITGGGLALGADADGAVAMASQQVNIHDGAMLSGFGSTAGDMDIRQGGTLAVANTTVGGNLHNSGTVLMNQPGAQPGNQLVVNGNYTGNNGLMAFNTELGDDQSATDKLMVKGDTAGNTRVQVNNVGGLGAQTTNGIELVNVGGNSAGNFALTTGTVEAGAWVYTLAKGQGDNAANWYLTSKWSGITPVQPPIVDPTGPSVLRPEAGSYISNLATANSFFTHRLHDRLGEPQYTEGLHDEDSFAGSLWMRHVGGHERSQAGDGQLKTQSNRYVLQVGGEVAQWSTSGQDRFHLGVMGGYANAHSNTRSDRAGYDSDGRVSGYSAGVYGTWYQNEADRSGAYVDSWLLYSWFDNSVEADDRERDDYRSKGLTASLEAGYTLKAGEFSGSAGTLNSWYVQPQAQVTWMGVKDDAHTRHDGTRIRSEGDGNVQTRLGVKTFLNSHHKQDEGKGREFQPYMEANWIYNSETYGVRMDGVRVSRDGSRNLGEVRTGVEGKLSQNLSVWGNVGVQMGDKGYSDTQGMLGVKYGW
ncbi:autotransporter outer membrane beta-barrel domain-containing protein [Pseudocitrobacter sp. 73]|uniref:autotransporter outer membrane beta-barrel domain-containing protein n=1 Tax=Pseudocitrobacter sp. 73 TaxID=2605731 RepID=UPI0011ED3D18|nr:autotransporter outer membrane beta-barrel domain-containing protein [Pseudocitrobacter sp. 73]KAA1048560.1 autotransporter outer membrane beta-barrel domain-containing protein [Pseudocitrobacter sp. 73]